MKQMVSADLAEEASAFWILLDMSYREGDNG